MFGTQKNKKIDREHNDLSCTSIDNFVPKHNLSTKHEQFTTHNDGSFDPTPYLNNPIQSFDCITSFAIPWVNKILRRHRGES